MNKKVKSLVATLVVCMFVIPASFANAKPNYEKNINNKKIETKEISNSKDKKEASKDKESTKEKKSENISQKKDEKKKDQISKHLDGMTNVISERLDNIENETLKLEEMINKYFKTETSSADDDKDEVAEEQTEGINETEEVEEVTEEAEATEEVENEVDEQVGDVDEEISEEEQADLEDTEKEFEEEDKGKVSSFYGKLNAELNKLNSVVNKLDSLSKKYGEDDEELLDAYAKVDAMKEKINSLISDLDAKQDSIVKSVREDKNKKELELKEDVAEDKSWEITFSKELDAETVNGENIVVSDAEGNIVAVNISYDAENKQVIINCTDGFESGKTYYLNISTNVKSVEGNNLSEAIEMGFTIK